MEPRSTILLLRSGLAFVFLYAAIAALLAPQNWVGYLPSFLTALVPARRLLIIFSAYELLLALWLLLGKKIAWAAGFAFLTLISITVASLNVLDVTFRDIGLAFAALALLDLTRGRRVIHRTS